MEDFLTSDIKKDHYRWRLVNGTLPLYERHLRSLRTFGMSVPLESWIRTRLEWTLDNLTSEQPNGVLCIDVSNDEMVTIHLDPPREAPRFEFDGTLVETGDETYSDDSIGQLWTFDGTTLLHHGPALSATNTLTRDLAKTLGYAVEETGEDLAGDGDVERFRVSDEFYVLPQGDPGAVTTRMIACFEKLVKNARAAS
jgi:hypothetical protein